MVTNLYVVRDVPAQQYSPPFPARNTAVAVRVMREMLRNVPTHLLAEYELYQVGSFCDASGTVESAVPEIVPASDQIVAAIKDLSELK